MSQLPSLPKLPRLGRASAPVATKPKPPKERRTNPRITIQELNAAGAEALKQRVKAVTKPEDRRPIWVRVFDALDLPRNIIGNVIGSIAGVEKGALPKGTFGLPRVFMSDVLKKLGVENKVVRGVAGFVGDVAIDPLTYYSLAATTGRLISKALPKVAPSGIKALGAIEKTGRITPEIGKALGLKAVTAARAAKRAAMGKPALEIARATRIQQFLKRHVIKAKGGAGGGEKFAKWIQELGEAGTKWEGRSAAEVVKEAAARSATSLVGKRGGLLTERLGKIATQPLGKTARAEEMLRGAREFIQKHAIKGRTVARLPLAERGLELPFGKQAKLYKGILDPEAIKQLMKAGQAGGAARKQFAKAGQLAGVVETINRAKKELGDLRKARKVAVKSHRARGAMEALKGKFEVTPKGQQALEKITGIAPAREAVADLDAQIAEKTAQLKRHVESTLGKDVADRIVEKVSHHAKPLAKEAVAGPEPIALPKALKQTVSAVQEQAAQARGKGEIARGVRSAILADPNAPEAIKALGAAELGATTAPAAGMTGAQRLAHGLRQAKQKVFGPGASPMHQREVAIHQHLHSGSSATGYRAGRAFQKEAAPVFANWAKKLGATQDEVAEAVIDLIESNHGANTGKFWAGDVIHESVKLSKQSGLADSPEIKALVDKYRAIHDDIERRLIAEGVAPGKMRDYYHRIGADSFRESAGMQKEMHPVKKWAAPRQRAIMPVDSEGNPILSVPLVSTADGIETANKYKAMGYKLVYGDISQHQHNLWSKATRAPNASLARPDYIGAQFSTDIAKSLSSSVAHAERMLAGAAARDLAMETGAKIPQRLVRRMPVFAGMAQPKIPQTSPFYHSIGRQLEGYSFPKPVADMLTRFFKVADSESEVRGLLKASDRIFGYWKGQALMHPAYTLRNVFQNLFGGLMAGANPLDVAQKSFNPRLREIARAVEEGRDVTGTILIHGREIPASVFMRSGKAYNMFNAGFTSQLLAQDIVGRAPRAIGTMAARGRAKFDDVFLTWHRWNNRVETNMRLATWMHFMEDGFTPRQAAMRTIMAMPDLSDISLWERNVASRIFPWYRWMRRNGSLQLFHYLPNKPAFFAGQTKLQHAIQAAMVQEPVREDLQPEWMQRELATQISGDSEQGQTGQGR